MLIVIQTCQRSVDLPINLSLKGDPLSPNLSKVIINRLYFPGISHHYFLLHLRNGPSDNFSLFTIRILLTLLWPFLNVYAYWT